MKIKVPIEQQIKADIEGYQRLAEFYYTYLNTRSSKFAEARLADCILKIEELKQDLIGLDFCPEPYEDDGDVIELD